MFWATIILGYLVFTLVYYLSLFALKETNPMDDGSKMGIRLFFLPVFPVVLLLGMCAWGYNKLLCKIKGHTFVQMNKVIEPNPEPNYIINQYKYCTRCDRTQKNDEYRDVR